MTTRCLAYRCRPADATDADSHDIYKNIADRMYESLELVKRLTTAEGREIPELDMMLSNDPRKMLSPPVVDDPLERMGRRYALVSSRYLVSRPDFPFAMKRRADGPTPFETFAWYHTLIAAKIYRAVISSAAAARGEADRRDDALGSAKAALLGIDRSRCALEECGRKRTMRGWTRCSDIFVVLAASWRVDFRMRAHSPGRASIQRINQ